MDQSGQLDHPPVPLHRLDRSRRWDPQLPADQWGQQVQSPPAIRSRLWHPSGRAGPSAPARRESRAARQVQSGRSARWGRADSRSPHRSLDSSNRRAGSPYCPVRRIESDDTYRSSFRENCRSIALRHFILCPGLLHGHCLPAARQNSGGYRPLRAHPAEPSPRARSRLRLAHADPCGRSTRTIRGMG